MGVISGSRQSSGFQRVAASSLFARISMGQSGFWDCTLFPETLSPEVHGHYDPGGRPESQ